MTTDIAIFVYAAIFAALGIRGLLDWRRHRDAASMWFGATFGALAVVVIASPVGVLAFGDPPPDAFSHVIILGITLYPPCLFFFASTFSRISVLERRVVVAATVVLAVWNFLVDLPAPGEQGDAFFAAFSIAFVAHWTIVSLRVVISFWRSGNRRPGVVRGRARLMAIAVSTLTLALLLQAADVDREHRTVIALVSATSAVLSLLAYSPPAWLRTVWRRRETERLRGAMTELLRAGSVDEVARTLLPATRDIVGATRVALFDDALGVTAAEGFDDETTQLLRRRVREQDAPDTANASVSSSIRVDGNIAIQRGSTWLVAELPSLAQTFGNEEQELLASMTSIAQIALDRLHGRDQIRSGEQRLLEVVEMAGLGDWEWVVGSDEVAWSPRMHEIFGTDPSVPMTYERYRSLLDSDELDELGDLLADAIARVAAYSVDHSITRPDGQVRFVHSRARVTVDPSGAKRVSGVTQDVTDRVRAEQNLRDAIETEREVTQRLRALDELKSNILSAVSHELRTPLTSVLGFSLTLRDRFEDLSPEQHREMLDHIVRESERLTTLLADLLDIDRLRRGVVEPNLTSVNLADVVRGVVASRERHASITLELEDVTCEIDVPKVERIVENLVANAEKHSGGDSQVWVRIECVDGANRIVVEDDGRGVPDEQRHAIFEPFNRGEEHLGHAPGTGIGLALVSQFAQLHGGSAWVGERPGGGASFVVELPCVPAAITDAVTA